MKLKELYESDSSPAPYVKFIFYLTGDFRPSKIDNTDFIEKLNLLKTKVNNKLLVSAPQMLDNDWALVVKYEITNTEASHAKFIVDLKQQVSDFIRLNIWHHFDNYQKAESIYISEVPNFKIDTDFVELIPTKNITLKNIDKMVKCNHFILKKLKYIQGNVLGLFSYNIIWPISSNTEWEWWNILRVGLNEKDPLETKIKLIDAGYKEYSKS